MVINYRSGFFRLWAMLSILWIGVVIAIVQPHTAILPLMGKGTVDIEMSNGPTFRFPAITSPSVVRQALMKWFEQSSATQGNTLNQFDAEPLLDQFITKVNHQHDLALEKLINFGMGAFSVPAVMFVLGFGCFWVIRGLIAR
jgi:hypothetical protein